MGWRCRRGHGGGRGCGGWLAHPRHGQRGPGGGVGRCVAAGSRRRAGRGGSAQAASRGKRVLLRALSLISSVGRAQRVGAGVGHASLRHRVNSMCHAHTYPHPRCPPSLLPPFPIASNSQCPPIPSHKGPPSTVTPRHTAQSGLRDRTATLHTYRSADKICGNRKECVRLGRGPAAHPHPARPDALCRGQLSPRDPCPATGCWRSRAPRAFPTWDPFQGHGGGLWDPR